MKISPYISFITICYNGFEDTCDLIISLQKNIRTVNYEIIVVDNASSNNEALHLQNRFPSIITIRSERNLGFSGGNNLGIKKAKGDFIFLINNDTYIIDDQLPHLIERFNNNPQIGGISPQIKFAFPPQKIQFAGFTPLSSITLRNSTIGYGMNDEGKYNNSYKTPYLHGAAMMIKREVINRVGMMPEIYFLYYEEIDWSTQITKHGYELWYEPAWTIYHKESQSTGQQSKLRTFYLTRNRLLYAWRNLNGISRWLSIIYQITIANIKNCITFLCKGKFDLISATFMGVFKFITLPDKKL